MTCKLKLTHNKLLNKLAFLSPLHSSHVMVLLSLLQLDNLGKFIFLRHTKVTVKLSLNVLSDIKKDRLPSLMTIITLFLHNFIIFFSYFGF